MNAPAPIPHEIVVTEHLWIPMPDGTRLAARMWCPAGAAQSPVPAIFEFIPYRKVDMVRARDERNHPYLAENGFASLRVDMRGSGDSEGHMPDMYDANELDDARHVIEWLAAQPWCNGRIGMFGTSWGGTASLQANVNAPDALKAVIAVCATHNRYEDDIHHMGGCLLTDSIEWGATLPTILGAPPSPNVDNWRSLWQERLDQLAFPLEHWLREEARGDYWRWGSVTHQAENLTAPMLCVGGWADRYSNSVMSLVDQAPDRTWGVVGPWGHHYPDQGHPAPGIGFQDLMLTWWRHWLLAEPEAAPDWPRLQVWQREFDTPQDAIPERSGAWVQSDTWSAASVMTNLHLGREGLVDHEQTDLNQGIPFDLTAGQAGADTGYFGRFGGLPPAQNDDDAASLCFDSPVLEEPLVIHGAARLALSLSTGESRRQICVRLNDVAPDGTSSRITWGILNLALDENLDAPAASLLPGVRSVTLTLPTTCYKLRVGHRLRVAISQSYWPMIWTPPTMGELTLLGGSLSLPVPKAKLETPVSALPPIRKLPRQVSHDTIAHEQIRRFGGTDQDGRLVSGWHQPFTALRFHETGTEFGYETRADYALDPTDPTSATCKFDHRMVFARPDGNATVHCIVEVTGDDSALRTTARFTAIWDDETVATKSWDFETTRNLS